MPNRILVIRRRYLGDIVLLGPVFANLRQAFPDAHIAGLVEPAFSAVLAMNPDVNEILPLPARRRDWPSFLLRLRRAGYTHVLDLDNNERTALLTRFTGAPRRIALSHYPLRWSLAYTGAVYDPPARHESRSIVDYYLESLSAIEVPVRTRTVRLVPAADDVAAAGRLLGIDPGRPGAGSPREHRILVHPGSRSAWRQWPPANFAAVCDRLQDELGVRIFVVGGPRDLPAIDEIASRARMHVVALRDALPVSRFAALASLADLVLCHDSGPMHLAAAVGTRVVALLGSQNPVVFAPPGEGHVIIQPPLPCTTCVAPDKCTPGDSYRNLCVQNITVDRVYDAVRDGLGAT